ncbi:hypothetical protein [Mariniluteicoccus flavus]
MSHGPDDPARPAADDDRPWFRDEVGPPLPPPGPQGPYAGPHPHPFGPPTQQFPAQQFPPTQQFPTTQQFPARPPQQPQHPPRRPQDPPPEERSFVPLLLILLVVIVIAGVAAFAFTQLRGRQGVEVTVPTPPATTVPPSPGPEPTARETPAPPEPTPAPSSAPPPAPRPPAVLPAGARECPAIHPASMSPGRSAIGNSATTCAFAEEVRLVYAAQPVRNARVDLSARSPVTRQTYPMVCTGDAVVTCTGGTNAVVHLL